MKGLGEFTQFLRNALPAVFHDNPVSVLGNLLHSLAFDAITAMSVEHLAQSTPDTSARTVVNLEVIHVLAVHMSMPND